MNKNYVFWSNLVKKEYCMKFNNIIDDIEEFLNCVEIVLKSNEKDFINYNTFEKFIFLKTKNVH